LIRFDTSNFFAQGPDVSSPASNASGHICETDSNDDSLSPDDDFEFPCVYQGMYKGQQAESESFEGGEDAGADQVSNAFPLQFLLEAVVAPVQMAAIKAEPDSNTLFDSTSLSYDGQHWLQNVALVKTECHDPGRHQIQSKPIIRLSKSPPFTCPLPECARKYRRKGDLKVHCVTKHPGMVSLHRSISTPKSTKEGKAFPCPVPSCRCGFKWERDLRRHIKGKHMPQKSDPTRPPKGWPRLPVEFNDLNMCRWSVGRR